MTSLVRDMSNLVQDDNWNYNYIHALDPPADTAHLIKPCATCKMLLSTGASVATLQLKNSAQTCPLCLMLSRQLSDLSQNESTVMLNNKAIISLQPSGRAISRVYTGTFSLSDSMLTALIAEYIRYCVAPHNLTEKLNKTLEHHQNEHAPIISFQWSQLMHAWLQSCDRYHACTEWHQYINKEFFPLPSRLLNVSPSEDSTDLRLDEACNVEGRKFIALSHCWGQSVGDQKPKWRTLQDNVASRIKGFKLDDLPKTFQDAIEVTRALRVPYIWIDSICIIQDDDNDWKHESKRMENVYALAYCTIAATSSRDSNAGFLGGRQDNESFYVKGSLGKTMYISTNIADFDKDVNEGGLNKRAWVMQERFLSPRTIHFTSTQVYGECGEGVYAGDNIFLRMNNQSIKFFQLDPSFPTRLQYSGYGATLSFLQSTLENYLQRDITRPSDRAIAILGLLTRIEKELRSSIDYGIIWCYLYRLLLWRRPVGKRLSKIDYGSVKVPSWSWMAYNGPVAFFHDPFGAHDCFKQFQLDGQVLNTVVWEITNPGISFLPTGSDSLDYQFQLQDSDGINIGFVSFDEEKVPVLFLAIISKYKKKQGNGLKYMVIFICHRASQDEGYQRLGMGVLNQKCRLRNIGEWRIF